MNNKNYLIVSGVIFAIASMAQLYRLLFQVPVQVDNINMPMWPSALGLIVALPMCLWAFWLANKS
jgi:hypothetical protein